MKGYEEYIMYQFLLISTNFEFLTVISATVLLVLIFLWMLQRKNPIGFQTLNYLTFMMAIAFIGLIFGGYGWTQKMEARQMRPADVYTINKTGEIITFKNKYSNLTLKDNVSAHIVSETDDKYQVEVDGDFYNMLKSDVK
jgi:hypothetical protein